MKFTMYIVTMVTLCGCLVVVQQYVLGIIVGSSTFVGGGWCCCPVRRAIGCVSQGRGGKDSDGFIVRNRVDVC